MLRTETPTEWCPEASELWRGTVLGLEVLEHRQQQECSGEQPEGADVEGCEGGFVDREVALIRRIVRAGIELDDVVVGEASGEQIGRAANQPYRECEWLRHFVTFATWLF
jgi:hypothetical protein